MRYGAMGTDIEIDLSRGKIEKLQSDPALVETYLGGKGKNVKILWDRVPPEVDAFSPDNLLIVSAGVLTGTMVPGANRTTFTYKSPVTDIHSYSNLGGFLGAEMKSAGYDTIVFAEKSPAPVYLWIDDDRVELRDASHLWGKDTFETQKIIREELKDNDLRIICIGQAGENKVLSASAEHGTGASASRGGVGAVMGDKKLKAIVVRGTKDINVADPARLAELCDPILRRSDRTRAFFDRSSGPQKIQGYARNADFGNRGGYVSPELQDKVDHSEDIVKEYMARITDDRVACYNCGQQCRHTYPRPDGNGYLFIKCTSWSAALLITKIFDMDLALKFYDVIEKYGMDSLAVANQIAFAIDLYEKGILTKEDTGGMVLEWENAEVAFDLVEKIARREGIGDILADGVYRAALRIGRGAEEFAYSVKKYDQHPFKRPGFGALLEGANDKGSSIKLLGPTPDSLWGRADREDLINSEYFHYPEEFKKYLKKKPDPRVDYEGACRFIAYNEENYNLADSLGICYFWVGRYAAPAINSRALIADLISAVTGMDIDEAGATKIARRVVNLVRGYNVRAGIRREDDVLPERYFQIPAVQGDYKPDRVVYSKWLDKWYEIKGWDNGGMPTRDTLEELGLDYVRQDLEQR